MKNPKYLSLPWENMEIVKNDPTGMRFFLTSGHQIVCLNIKTTEVTRYTFQKFSKNFGKKALANLVQSPLSQQDIALVTHLKNLYMERTAAMTSILLRDVRQEMLSAKAGSKNFGQIALVTDI